MFKDLFSNRLFIGAIVFFVLTVGGSLLYMRHVQRQTARELAATQERVKELTEKQNPTAEAPVAQGLQGHFHSDGTWHGGPHTPHTPADVSFKSGTPTSTDAPPGASLEQFSETETPPEKSTQRDPNFVFNSPTLYPHEIKQWGSGFLHRLKTNHPELVRMASMTSSEVLEAYTPSEIAALHKEWKQIESAFLAEFHAFVESLPEDMRAPVIESVYQETIDKHGPEQAKKSMAILFPSYF
ncbi:hypothetical protein F4054_23620 [Candidatus Poribacteria bacterium]|nr:hypothetical protein [Candidatus Poribacteria bacterium]MYG06043.1 hypothetical protein [Candidatus Poribacteria bacterium]MYK25242.1 hypothetical protein [Candidatus Poribacteria bacterium]